MKSVCCVIIFLLTMVQAQVRTPDRFVNAGVTFSLNQEMLDSMKEISIEICKELNETMTNLHIDRALHLIVDDPKSEKGTSDLMIWSISGLNITNISFDMSSSNFMLIEPTQMIKLYFNNVRFHLNFTSNFSFVNKELLNYTEVTNVQVKIESINALTLLLKLEVDPKTNKLNTFLEKTVLAADPKGI